ncbi:MAG: type I restriction-modification system subunit M, partial [Bacillus sp. (in: Bacteria)]|nr:type I restriction-modification system subunit M [Bacillus sp. (in: firmicutes)]
YALMYGGIPSSEIDSIEALSHLPGLRDALFTGEEYCQLIGSDISSIIRKHESVKTFKETYMKSIGGLDSALHRMLIDGVLDVSTKTQEIVITDDVMQRLKGIPLIDGYVAFQIIDDVWSTIGSDIDLIQREGIDAVRGVDPHMVIKKKDDKEEEVQEGWEGRILPFATVQKELFPDELEHIQACTSRLGAIDVELNELKENLSEEDGEFSILNEDNTQFDAAAVSAKLNEFYSENLTPELKTLYEYLEIKGTAKNKIAYMNGHGECNWAAIEKTSNGYGSATSVKSRISELQSMIRFPEGSFEETTARVSNLLAEKKVVRAEEKSANAALHQKTKEAIETLDDEQVGTLLHAHWIDPIMTRLMKTPDEVIDKLVDEVGYLAKKYAITYDDVCDSIKNTEKELSELLGTLNGNEYDMAGLAEFARLLGGE